jgi:hypothetical protein
LYRLGRQCSFVEMAAGIDHATMERELRAIGVTNPNEIKEAQKQAIIHSYAKKGQEKLSGAKEATEDSILRDLESLRSAEIGSLENLRLGDKITCVVTEPSKLGKWAKAKVDELEEVEAQDGGVQKLSGLVNQAIADAKQQDAELFDGLDGMSDAMQLAVRKMVYAHLSKLLAIHVVASYRDLESDTARDKLLEEMTEFLGASKESTMAMKALKSHFKLRARAKGLRKSVNANDDGDSSDEDEGPAKKRSKSEKKPAVKKEEGADDDDGDKKFEDTDLEWGPCDTGDQAQKALYSKVGRCYQCGRFGTQKEHKKGKKNHGHKK